ncbi:MAG TPA: hypothetical protein PK720_02700 [bacterium]|nr:hypothetical protein [bacterium]
MIERLNQSTQTSFQSTQTSSIFDLLNLTKLDVNGEKLLYQNYFNENYSSVKDLKLNSFSISGIIPHPLGNIKIIYQGDEPNNEPRIIPGFKLLKSKNNLFLSKFEVTPGFNDRKAAEFTSNDLRCLQLKNIKDKIKDVYFIRPKTVDIYKIGIDILLKKISTC